MVIVIKKNASKEEINKAWERLNQSRKNKGVDTTKYCGAIHFEQDALALQKKWRDEWN